MNHEISPSRSKRFFGLIYHDVNDLRPDGEVGAAGALKRGESDDAHTQKPTMFTFQPLTAQSAPISARELLTEMEEALGHVPNLFAALAHSPEALRGFLQMREALCEGTLSPALREQTALRVAELTGSDYGVAAHAALGAVAGLGRDGIADGRRGYSPDPRTDAALQFAERLVLGAGCVAAADLERLAGSGWTQAQVLEIAAIVALTLMESYVASIVAPRIDFPTPPRLDLRGTALRPTYLYPGGAR